MEDMLAQVQASKNLLDALRALPRFPDISRSECARLQGCLALHALTPAQLASVAQGVKQAGFLQKDEELLLDLVASATCQSAPPPAAGKGSRVGLQDWETVPAFFPGGSLEYDETRGVCGRVGFPRAHGNEEPG